MSNKQLLGVASRSSVYIFDETSVKVYINTYDLGLVEYTLNLDIAGTPDFENGSALAIYPNPTSDVLNISFKDSTVNQVAIYSLTGTKVMEMEGTSNLNISQLAAGTYLVRVLDNNKGVFFKRIIKH